MSIDCARNSTLECNGIGQVIAATAMFPSKPVVGEVEVITEFAAEQEIHHEWEPQELRDNIAERDAKLRFRGK